MRIAVISDLHSNLEALNCVLEDIDNNNIDKIYCLGDIVGYGPQPEEIIALLKKRKIKCIMGNHDMAVFDDEELAGFSRVAYDAIIETRKILKKSTVNYLKKLPSNITTDNVLYVHGAPRDEVSRYLFELDDQRIITITKSSRQKIFFVGHMHLLLMYEIDGDTVNIEDLENEIVQLDKNKKYIFNTGSVGQPRDGSPFAKYGILDEEEYTLEVRFVQYDILKTVALIKKSGFHEINGARLLNGL